MTQLASSLARGLAAVLLVAGCSKVTMVSPEAPIEISAKPPALPLPDLPAVEQPPPPPPRVLVEGDQLRLDETIGFDEHDQLSPDHRDILAEVAAWLADKGDVTKLGVEVHESGEGSRRAKKKRAKAMAVQIVEALVQLGVAVDRLEPVVVEAAEDGLPHPTFRIRERAEEKPQ
jgi:hypothetical protein